MKIKAAVDLFLLDCQIKRLKPRSIKMYSIHLKYFLAFCSSNNVESLDKVDSIFIKHYTLSLLQRTQSYQRNLLSIVNNFLVYCVSDGLLQVKPKVKLPNKIIRVKKSLSKDDIHKILAACRNKKQTLIILFYLDTGLRMNEGISVDVSDVDLSNGLVHVKNGKNGERFVSIGIKVRKAILLYLDGRIDGPLLLTNSKKRYSISGMTKIMKNLRKRSGILHFSCHAMRRTFVTKCLRNSMPIDIVARLSGHSDYQTLKNHYIDTNTDDLIEAQAKYGLIDNL